MEKSKYHTGLSKKRPPAKHSTTQDHILEADKTETSEDGRSSVVIVRGVRLSIFHLQQTVMTRLPPSRCTCETLDWHLPSWDNQQPTVDRHQILPLKQWNFIGEGTVISFWRLALHFGPPLTVTFLLFISGKCNFDSKIESRKRSNPAMIGYGDQADPWECVAGLAHRADKRGSPSANPLCCSFLLKSRLVRFSVSRKLNWQVNSHSLTPEASSLPFPSPPFSFHSTVHTTSVVCIRWHGHAWPPPLPQGTRNKSFPSEPYVIK
jgi:hypothetical protein